MRARGGQHEVHGFDGQTAWPLARSAGAAVASLSMFGALAVALVASSQHVPGPAGWTYPELETWIERQPVSAAFCLLSTVALIVVVYLMLSTVALVVARAARAARLHRLERVAQTIAVPAIRRSLAALLGLSLTVASNTGPAHGDSLAARAAPVVTATTTADPESTSATMRSLDEPEAERPSAASGSAAPNSWTVRPGDHLWGLAESTLASAWARHPEDTEVAGYLRAVIDLNAEILVLPGHPDLIFPGQVFAQPAVPPLP